MNAAKIISFVQQKGGTGKTTSSISVAGHLALAGHKVLLVDLDPQASATTGSGINPSVHDVHMYNVLIEDLDIRQILLETNAGYHLAPSGVDLLGAEAKLYQRAGRRLLSLSLALESVKPYYDYIVVDTPPGTGLLAFNGIIASNLVFVTFDPGIFALESYRSLEMLFDELGDMLDRDIVIAGGILTRWRRVTFQWQNDRQLDDLPRKLAEKFGRLFVVPFSHQIQESQIVGMPISHFAPKSQSSLVYKEISDYIEEITNGG